MKKHVRERPTRPFVDPDPFQELTFPSVIDAKRAIADYLKQPLGRLPQDRTQSLQQEVINLGEDQVNCYKKPSWLPFPSA